MKKSEALSETRLMAEINAAFMLQVRDIPLRQQQRTGKWWKQGPTVHFDAAKPGKGIKQAVTARVGDVETYHRRKSSGFSSRFSQAA
ncbi:MAG: hypothetical protein RIM72_01200 [Alphaproteobacteria bacterium]